MQKPRWCPRWLSWENVWRTLFSVFTIALTIAVLSLAVLNVVGRAQDKARIVRLQDVIDTQYATIAQGACYDKIEFEYESAVGEFFIVVVDSALAQTEDPTQEVLDRLRASRQRLETAEDRLESVEDICPSPARPPAKELP